jgi:hypothetical protein
LLTLEQRQDLGQSFSGIGLCYWDSSTMMSSFLFNYSMKLLRTTVGTCNWPRLLHETTPVGTCNWERFASAYISHTVYAYVICLKVEVTFHLLSWVISCSFWFYQTLALLRARGGVK